MSKSGNMLRIPPAERTRPFSQVYSETGAAYVGNPPYKLMKLTDADKIKMTAQPFTEYLLNELYSQVMSGQNPNENPLHSDNKQQFSLSMSELIMNNQIDLEGHIRKWIISNVTNSFIGKFYNIKISKDLPVVKHWSRIIFGDYEPAAMTTRRGWATSGSFSQEEGLTSIRTIGKAVEAQLDFLRYPEMRDQFDLQMFALLEDISRTHLYRVLLSFQETELYYATPQKRINGDIRLPKTVHDVILNRGQLMNIGHKSKFAFGHVVDIARKTLSQNGGDVKNVILNDNDLIHIIHNNETATRHLSSMISGVRNQVMWELPSTMDDLEVVRTPPMDLEHKNISSWNGTSVIGQACTWINEDNSRRGSAKDFRTVQRTVFVASPVDNEWHPYPVTAGASGSIDIVPIDEFGDDSAIGGMVDNKHRPGHLNLDVQAIVRDSLRATRTASAEQRHIPDAFYNTRTKRTAENEIIGAPIVRRVHKYEDAGGGNIRLKETESDFVPLCLYGEQPQNCAKDSAFEFAIETLVNQLFFNFPDDYAEEFEKSVDAIIKERAGVGAKSAAGSIVANIIDHLKGVESEILYDNALEEVAADLVWDRVVVAGRTPLIGEVLDSNKYEDALTIARKELIAEDKFFSGESTKYRMLPTKNSVEFSKDGKNMSDLHRRILNASTFPPQKRYAALLYYCQPACWQIFERSQQNDVAVMWSYRYDRPNETYLMRDLTFTTGNKLGEFESTGINPRVISDVRNRKITNVVENSFSIANINREQQFIQPYFYCSRINGGVGPHIFPIHKFLRRPYRDRIDHMYRTNQCVIATTSTINESIDVNKIRPVYDYRGFYDAGKLILELTESRDFAIEQEKVQASGILIKAALRIYDGYNNDATYIQHKSQQNLSISRSIETIAPYATVMTYDPIIGKCKVKEGYHTMHKGFATGLKEMIEGRITVEKANALQKVVEPAYMIHY